MLAIDSPLLVGAFVSEALGEGVVVDLQLGDLKGGEENEGERSVMKGKGSRRGSW